MKKVAVVILNYNSSNDCRKCISFLQKQMGVELEIVVVDNHSGSEDKNAIEQLCKKHSCTFIQAKENRGYNAGNNIGLRYATSKGYKYVMIANPDMEFPQQDYIAKLVGVLEHDANVVVCGSDIITPEGIHQNPMKRDGDWRSCFAWLVALFKKKKNADSYDFIDNYRESHYCYKVSGCCLMVRLDFIREIGYFDEQVFLYCEEAILAQQVQQACKQSFYTAEIQAIHRHIKSEKRNPISRLKSWRLSRTYYIKRYSQYSRFGKISSIISLYAYIGVLIIYNQVKRLKC